MINNELVSDKAIIADAFNKFYVNIGPSLAKQIRHDEKDPVSFVKNSIAGSMFLTQVTQEEISRIIISLKTSSPGWDDIHAKVIKEWLN